MPNQKPQPTTIQLLRNLLNHLEIFRAPDTTPCTRIPQGPFRLLTLPLASSEMDNWLLVTAYEKLGLIPTTAQIHQALRPFVASATFCHHATRPTPLRFHKTANSLSLDLGDHVNAVIIDANGWRIIEDLETAWLTPIKQLPMLAPEATTSSLCELLADALTIDTADATKLAHWIAKACHPSPYPQPPLVFTGPARHQSAELLRNLIDPSSTPLQNPARAHIQSETKGLHLLVFPEVSRLTDTLRRLTQPVIYTNEIAIKQVEQPLTLHITQWNKPSITRLLGALCNYLAQNMADLAEPSEPSDTNAVQAETTLMVPLRVLTPGVIEATALAKTQAVTESHLKYWKQSPHHSALASISTCSNLDDSQTSSNSSLVSPSRHTKACKSSSVDWCQCLWSQKTADSTQFYGKSRSRHH